MWFKWRNKNQGNRITVEISPSMAMTSSTAQQEIFADSEEMKKKKKTWKSILLIFWAPIMIILSFLFWILLNTNIFTMTGEEQGRLLSTYTLLLGFYITVRYIFFQLRESKSLSKYRTTVYWMIAEYASYVGWLLLFTATIIGVIDYIITNPSILLYAIELSLLFTALIYALIDFLSASKAYTYI
jgi:TRAP-type C4-dicarboxylate transport system permease large subunit